VVLTPEAYTKLQGDLANISSNDHNLIIQIKRDLLKSLSDVVPDGVKKEVMVGTDLTLPMRITYVDLTDLKRSTRIPELVLYRSEFYDLKNFIEEHDKKIGDKSSYKFITGTPGIGVSLRYFSA
jgi:hypothetical protein